MLHYLKNLKTNLIVTSLAVVFLLTLSVLALVIVPTLTTPVMAAPTTTPFIVPVAPAPAKLKSLTMPTTGFASWYGSVLQGHHTASGERFNKDDLTAAHRSLPFGTLVRVVDVNTGRSVIVRINDRGVLFPERIIDLSSAAAQNLGILKAGIARVRIEVLKKTPASEATPPSTEVAHL